MIASVQTEHYVDIEEHSSVSLTLNNHHQSGKHFQQKFELSHFWQCNEPIDIRYDNINFDMHTSYAGLVIMKDPSSA